MALTKIPQETTIAIATSPTVVPAKTIACMNYTTADTLMYLVPAGRKFEGFVGIASSNAYLAIVVAGATLSNSVNSNKLDQTKMPMPNQYWGSTNNIKFTLHAGDKIYGSNANSVAAKILGVETDA